MPFTAVKAANGVLGRHGAERIEHQATLGNGERNGAQPAHLGQRKAAGAQVFVACGQEGARLERVESCPHPRPDGVCARDGQLLCHDDGSKPGEARLAQAQRRPCAGLHQFADQRVGGGEGAKGFIERRLAVDDARHRVTSP